MNFRLRIRRPNRAMISAAAKHVGKSKPGKKTKPCSTPALQDAIKQRSTLRRTVQSNRVEYLAACGEVRRLSEEARRTKWEEFLANLEGFEPNQITLGIPPLHCLQRTPNPQRPYVSDEYRKSQRLRSTICSCEPTLSRQNRAYLSSPPKEGTTATICS